MDSGSVTHRVTVAQHSLLSVVAADRNAKGSLNRLPCNSLNLRCIITARFVVGG